MWHWTGEVGWVGQERAVQIVCANADASVPVANGGTSVRLDKMAAVEAGGVGRAAVAFPPKVCGTPGAADPSPDVELGGAVVVRTVVTCAGCTGAADADASMPPVLDLGGPGAVPFSAWLGETWWGIGVVPWLTASATVDKPSWTAALVEWTCTPLVALLSREP